jgi:hypothetical protein
LARAIVDVFEHRTFLERGTLQQARVAAILTTQYLALE